MKYFTFGCFFSILSIRYCLFTMRYYMCISVSNRFWFPHTYTPFTMLERGKKTTIYTQSHTSNGLLLWPEQFTSFTVHMMIQFIKFVVIFIQSRLSRMCSFVIYNWICFFVGFEWKIELICLCYTLLYADTFVDDLKKKTNRLRMTINLCHDWRFDQNEKLRTKWTQRIAHITTMRWNANVTMQPMVLPRISNSHHFPHTKQSPRFVQLVAI